MYSGVYDVTQFGVLFDLFYWNAVWCWMKTNLSHSFQSYKCIEWAKASRKLRLLRLSGKNGTALQMHQINLVWVGHTAHKHHTHKFTRTLRLKSTYMYSQLFISSGPKRNARNTVFIFPWTTLYMYLLFIDIVYLLCVCVCFTAKVMMLWSKATHLLCMLCSLPLTYLNITYYRIIKKVDNNNFCE